MEAARQTGGSADSYALRRAYVARQGLKEPPRAVSTAVARCRAFGRNGGPRLFPRLPAPLWADSRPPDGTRGPGLPRARRGVLKGCAGSPEG